ncbi:MAG TPA: hypothetical protein VJ986_04690 [Gaiellaceae bacterium]|nr:hypothetical protein [Gaiellaceae bacterium]
MHSATLLALALAAGTNALPAARGTPTIRYPVHANVVATVFWVGEPKGNGSSEDNALSAWDDRWLQHYGGVDDPRKRRPYPYFPPFRPHENPFYLDLPYNDFDDHGNPRPGRTKVIPWAPAYATALAASKRTGRPFSLMKNRWVKISRHVGKRTLVCYGQIEDAGPYVYDDAAYVFGTEGQRPKNTRASHAGLDVSPAIRDCLHFPGLNDARTKVRWQFVEARAVPPGPWRIVVTTRQVYWP